MTMIMMMVMTRGCQDDAFVSQAREEEQLKKKWLIGQPN